MYYCKSRYYVPEWRRWLNADSITYLDASDMNGMNLFSYCGNNPVMLIDSTGNSPKWWQWALNGLALVGGIALCATGIGTGFGVSLIVTGGSMLASNIMDAAGMDSRLATQISAGLNIFAGSILLATPFAGIGASMIGSGIGSFAGGYISEKLGGSYELGAGIGSVIGGYLGGKIYNGLKNSGRIPFKVKSNSLVNNPTDPFIDPLIGPKQGEVVNKIYQIQNTGRYDPISVTKMTNGQYMIDNGHHTFRALQSLGYKYVWVIF